jgi:uncharacterized membrane protein YfcA
MDGLLDITIFLVATFVAALVAGLAGFAFGLVASAVWLHVLTPLQTASLIIGFGLIVQGVAVWKLRRALSWTRLWPFLLGGALGVPAGVAILAWANPGHLRTGVGVLLILYSIYALAQPAMKPLAAGGAGADTRLGSPTAFSAARPGLPASSLPSGAACVAGRRMSSARCFSRPAWRCLP